MATKKAVKKVQYIATGRRKSAIARVRLIPGGEGQIVINKRTIEEYFPMDTTRLIVNQPLEATGTKDKFDVFVNVKGRYNRSGRRNPSRHRKSALHRGQRRLPSHSQKSRFPHERPQSQRKKEIRTSQGKKGSAILKEITSRLQYSNSKRPNIGRFLYCKLSRLRAAFPCSGDNADSVFQPLKEQMSYKTFLNLSYE